MFCSRVRARSWSDCSRSRRHGRRSTIAGEPRGKLTDVVMSRFGVHSRQVKSRKCVHVIWTDKDMEESADERDFTG